MRRPGILNKSVFQKPELFFVVFAGIFGLIFILLMPPLQTPDEQAHFLRVYQISQLHFISKDTGGVPGDDLPSSLSKTMKLLDTPTIEFHTDRKYNIHSTAAALKINLNKSKTKYTSIASTSAYSPIGYIPQAVLVGLTSIFNAPPVLLMYAARAGSLGAWLGLVFAAIRILPYRKWTVAGLALLPMLIGQAGSPGIDAISIGLGILFIAIILRLCREVSIPRRWWAILLVLGCLIALTKQTTFLVIGFVFLLPSDRFDSTRFKGILMKALIIIIPFLCIAVWTLATSYLHLTSGSGIPHQSFHGQLSNIILNPFRFWQVVFNTFFLTWGDSVIASFAGVFGWADTPLSEGIIVAVFIYIAYLLLRSYERREVGYKKSVVITTTIILILYIVGTMAALYLLYSPVNFDIIYGLQGRYFLLALFIALPLCQLIRKTTDLKVYATVVRTVAPIVLVCAGLTIYLRFYVKLF